MLRSRLPVVRRTVGLVAVAAMTVGMAMPAFAAQGDKKPKDPSEAPSAEPTPTPEPEPTPTPEPEPTPEPTPTPTPTPTETCIGDEDEGAVSFGDVDRNCDGVLVLSEQGDPLSIRRTVDIGGPAGETEDRFEPTDFVRGTLVSFDETSRRGGTITSGSLVYTPPDGFVGSDRFTFMMLGSDDVTREVEVIVEVRENEPEPTPTATPDDEDDAADADEAQIEADAAEQILGAVEIVERTPRWEPAWLVWMTVTAVLLLGLAATWWLLLVVRIQDRLMGP